ncbi:MAG TPA: PQQ-binding-like beta-propeller repeat protein [Terriglobia bacterium]|nr:PQQ-binding-like beta-propeller repeat protein [Terriglobia bacterium]
MAQQSGSLLFVGIKGAVLGLDKSNGAEVWRTQLGGSYFVNLAMEGDNLYAGTRGQIFCLSPSSGAIRWKNELKGLGLGLVTIGTPGGQNVALAAKTLQDQAAVAAGAAAASTAASS